MRGLRICLRTYSAKQDIFENDPAEQLWNSHAFSYSLLSSLFVYHESDLPCFPSRALSDLRAVELNRNQNSPLCRSHTASLILGTTSL